MAQFLGYRIKSTNIGRVEKTLRAAKENIRLAAQEEYHRLLSDEISEVIDNVTLQIMQRPGRPIFDEAVARLNDRIGKAEMSSSGTEYDLRTGVTVIPDKDYTYVMLSLSNPALEKAFCDTPGIENYKISDDDETETTKTEAVAKWESLRSRCEESPALLSANLTNRMVPSVDAVTFESPVSRARTRARRTMTSRLLNQYACGQQIQSSQLMPLMDKALERLMDEDVQKEMDAMTVQLASTLVEITREMVLFDPSKPVQEPEPEEPSKTDTDAGDGGFLEENNDNEEGNSSGDC